MTLNRLQLFIKRILFNKLYLIMLASIVILSVVYQLIPAKHKSAEILVPIFIEDKSDYVDEFWNELDGANTIYTFYSVDSKETVRQQVESGKAECGFFIPSNFFIDYISGIELDEKMTRYDSNTTTLGSTVTETIFSHIFKICSPGILDFTCNKPDYNDELNERLYDYTHGDRVFQVEDHVGDRMIEDGVDVPVNLPVYQLSVLLIIFSGLLGLLMYTADAEKNFYIALHNSDRLNIRICSVIGSIIPLLMTAIICCLITYHKPQQILFLILSGIITTIISLFPGCLIKKSSTLVKVLPIVMLILIPLTLLL